jgi:hypothetical protein
MASDWWRSEAIDDLDLAEQEHLYRAETKDKPWLVGFDERFQRWLDSRSVLAMHQPAS